MNWFTDIKSYFEQGLYTAEEVEAFVQAGWISQAEAEEIKRSEPCMRVR